MPPLVSIAIRAFRRQFLAEAIASVLAQTYSRLELVIYDDAGDLEEVAASFQDARIRYQRALVRRPASGRFLAAVALCTGEYIGVLDDDDRYEPEFVARLLQALDNDAEAGIALSRLTFDVSGRMETPVDRRVAGRQPEVVRQMLGEHWTASPSHMLLRRAALDAAWRDQPMPDDVAPDVWTNLAVAQAGWHHVLVDAPLVLCRWHGDQVSRSGLAASCMAVSTWEQLHVTDVSCAPLRKRKLARAYLVRGMEYLRAGDTPRAIVDLRAAASTSSSAWPVARRLLRAAAACGPVGSLVVRLWLDWSPRGRQRQRPPRTLGERLTE